MPNENPSNILELQKTSVLKLSAATGLAAVIEVIALHSLDTSVKRLQNNPFPCYSTKLTSGANYTALKNVLFKEAINKNCFYKVTSLYRGVFPAMGYKILQRGALELQHQLHKWMEVYFQTKSHWIDLASGLTVGVAEGIVLLPIDYYKVVAQTRNQPIEKSTLNPKQEFPKQESLDKKDSTIFNALRKSFTALGATVSRNVIFLATLSLVRSTAEEYQLKKNNSANEANQKRELTSSQKVIAGAIGAGAATLVSSPLDVVKVRQQAQSSNSSVKKGFFELTKEMMTKEGPTSLLKGMLPKTIMVSARMSLFFGMQEFLLKKIMGKHETIGDNQHKMSIRPH